MESHFQALKGKELKQSNRCLQSSKEDAERKPRPAAQQLPGVGPTATRPHRPLRVAGEYHSMSRPSSSRAVFQAGSVRGRQLHSGTHARSDGAVARRREREEAGAPAAAPETPWRRPGGGRQRKTQHAKQARGSVCGIKCAFILNVFPGHTFLFSCRQTRQLLPWEQHVTVGLRALPPSCAAPGRPRRASVRVGSAMTL